MPVHTWKDCLMLEMGFGDIMVATGARDGIEDEIVFIPGDSGEIGRTNPEAVGKSSDDLGAVCRIVFHKRESIDVVIGKLEELKARWKPTPEPRDKEG